MSTSSALQSAIGKRRDISSFDDVSRVAEEMRHILAGFEANLRTLASRLELERLERLRIETKGAVDVAPLQARIEALEDRPQAVAAPVAPMPPPMPVAAPGPSLERVTAIEQVLGELHDRVAKLEAALPPDTLAVDVATIKRQLHAMETVLGGGS